MTHLTLPSGDWLIVKVPEGFFKRELITDLSGNTVIKTTDRVGDYSLSYPLPPGSWQLYGEDPLRLTEEECRGIVEPLFSHEDIYGDGKHGNYRHELNLSPMPYKSYTWPQDGLYSSKDTATESFASLLTANGHKQGECVILKKK